MASEETVVEDGHEFIYRLTAIGDSGKVETKYFKSPYETRGWRDRLRETGYEAQAARVPASGFESLEDAELDRLADEEAAEVPPRADDWVERLRREVLKEGGVWTGKRAMEYLKSIGFNCTLERARVCMQKVSARQPDRVVVSEGRRWIWEVR